LSTPSNVTKPSHWPPYILPQYYSEVSDYH
jgi:hypothetical protein